ncbi:MAG: type II toxin-antitoxin system RelE/ParE family toxin [Treponema sp.]|nr:type II toxin-antitoxin system RelE/ParE family toxin [Treponema sp.]
MRVFKNTWFARYAGKAGISDNELREAVSQLEAGAGGANFGGANFGGANLGGDVYKVRIARPGKGKSGGYRVIVLFRSGERTFYVYAFAKSERANISEKELRNMKRAAKKYFSMTPDQLAERVKNGQLIEL